VVEIFGYEHGITKQEDLNEYGVFLVVMSNNQGEKRY